MLGCRVIASQAAGQPHPALGGAQPQPAVELGGRQVGRVGVAGAGQQPGLVGHLDQQRGGRLADIQHPGQPAQVAHAEPAGPQLRGRLGGQRVQQQFDQPDGLQHRGGAAAVDHRRAGFGQPQRFRLGVHRTGRLLAQRQRDLARQLHRVVVDRHQQPAFHQRPGRARLHTPGTAASRSPPTGGPAASRSRIARSGSSACSISSGSRSSTAAAADAARARLGGRRQAERAQQRGQRDVVHRAEQVLAPTAEAGRVRDRAPRGPSRPGAAPRPSPQTSSHSRSSRTARRHRVPRRRR